MTIIHKTLWNRLSGRYEIGDIHLLNILYSNLYNRYTCAKSLFYKNSICYPAWIIYWPDENRFKQFIDFLSDGFAPLWSVSSFFLIDQFVRWVNA
jgi:hypothetical protein